MLTVRIQEKNHSESIMVLKLKDGYRLSFFCSRYFFTKNTLTNAHFFYIT